MILTRLQMDNLRSEDSLDRCPPVDYSSSISSAPCDDWTSVDNIRIKKFVASMTRNPRVKCPLCETIWKVKWNTQLARDVMNNASTGKYMTLSNRWECPTCNSEFEQCPPDMLYRYTEFGDSLTDNDRQSIRDAAAVRNSIYIKRNFRKRA